MAAHFKEATSTTSPPASEVSDQKDGDKSQRSSRRLSPLVVIGVIAAALLVLALALGLGLGLGLHRHHLVSVASTTGNGGSGTNGSNSSTTPLDSYASLNVPSWRLNTEEYNLDLANWDLDAPPTTRTYDWTISETDLAPDGMYVPSEMSDIVANLHRRCSKDACHQWPVPRSSC